MQFKSIEVERFCSRLKSDFSDLSLKGGISLRLAERIDSQLNVSTDDLNINELSQAWYEVSVKDINKYRFCFPFLDEIGFRYYVPSILLLCVEYPEKLHEEVFDTLYEILSVGFTSRIFSKSLPDFFTDEQLTLIQQGVKLITSEDHPYVDKNEFEDLLIQFHSY